MNRAVTIFMALLLVLLASCATATPAVTSSPEIATGTPDSLSALEQRPLHLPTVSAGTPCPITHEHTVTSQYGLALGDGPIYPVGPWANGVYDYQGVAQTAGWYFLKVLWIGRPTFSGLALIRGRQLDGSHQLHFQLGLGSPSGADMRFLGTHFDPGGWTGQPSYTLVQTPGCYAYQVDGPNFSTVIIFEAVDTP